MKFNRNILDQLEIPDFVLTKANGDRIGVLPCTQKEYTAHFDTPDEIQFTSYMYNNDELNPYYDRLENMQYIEVPGDARYIIQDVSEHSEGTKLAYKSVTCKSAEVVFAQRNLNLFTINYGTTVSIDGVQFYNLADPAHSLLNLVVSELFPSWNIGHVDAALTTMQRSFEVTQQDVYSFLMDNVATAFECHFTFDTLSYTINAYTNENVGRDTNIHLSFNNLVKNTDLSCSTDDIKTCLVLTGQDDLNIRELARGQDRIYDFDYYNSLEFWSKSLYDAYNAWQTLTYHTPVDWDVMEDLTYVDSSGEVQHYFKFSDKKDLDGRYILNKTATPIEYQTFIHDNNLEDNYNNLYTFLLARYQGYYNDVSEWTVTHIPAGNNARYFGYGSYPEGYPDHIDMESTEIFQIDRYTSVVEVDSLPAEADENVLYLKKDDSNEMWRKYGVDWVNTNIWNEIALNPLNEKLKSAEGNQAAAMKNGYGSRTIDMNPGASEAEKARQEKNYVSYYLPYYYSINELNKAIAAVQAKLDVYKECQSILNSAMAGVAEYTSMDANFTKPQLMELSKFIRENDLSSQNYIVTDIMTEQERFEMLNDFLKFGETELKKVAQPQISFSLGMANIFSLPEFDKYAGYFDVGNYVHITLRDDYLIKATLTEMHVNFNDPTGFSVTFSNVLRKSKKGVLSDIGDMAKEAHSIATSVSFNASYWSAQSKNADVITQQLADGLLEAGNFLRSGIHSEFLTDERGIFVTTVSDDPSDPNYDHAKTSDTDTDYDSIYIGGGRILFTDDGWKTVKMSVGRGTVSIPQIIDGKLVMTQTSKFGVFADFLVAGYVGGSTIVGGNIYSSDYQTSNNKTTGNYGVRIDLNNSEFEFNGDGKKILTLKKDALTNKYGLQMLGTIYATKGQIGCNENGAGGFEITTNAIRNQKQTWNDDKDGVYISTQYIALGPATDKKIGSTTVKQYAFLVDNLGNLTANKGRIGGFYIDDESIYSISPKTSSGEGSIVFSTTDVNRSVMGANRNVRLAVGSKFGVDKNGKLYCQDATIGSSGQYGIVDISNGSIHVNTEDGSSTGIHIISDGDKDDQYELGLRGHEFYFWDRDDREPVFVNVKWINIYNIINYFYSKNNNDWINYDNLKSVIDHFVAYGLWTPAS